MGSHFDIIWCYQGDYARGRGGMELKSEGLCFESAGQNFKLGSSESL